MSLSPQVELHVHDLDPRAIQVVEGRRLGDPRTALDAALMSYRMMVVTHVKNELTKRATITGSELMKMLDMASQLFLPKYHKIVGPYTAQAYLAAYTEAQAGEVPIEVIYALAQQHTERTGAYFADTSRDAIEHGFNAYVNRKVPAKAAADQVMDAYGLTIRQMNGVVSLAPEGKVLSAQPRSLKARVREYIGRSLRSRLKLFDEQELRNIDSQAAQTAWLWLQQHGRIPENAQKVWITARDERTCKQCAPMHNKRVGMDERFTLPNGAELYVPGAHVNCRCQVRLLATVSPISKADEWDPDEHPRGGDPRNRGRFSRVLEADRPDVSGFARFLAEAERRHAEPEAGLVSTPRTSLASTRLTSTPKEQPITSTAKPVTSLASNAKPAVRLSSTSSPQAVETSMVSLAKPAISTQGMTSVGTKAEVQATTNLAPYQHDIPLNEDHDYYYAVHLPTEGPPSDWDYQLQGKTFYFDRLRAQREVVKERQKIIQDKYNRATNWGKDDTVQVQALDPNTREVLHGEVSSEDLMAAIRSSAAAGAGEIYYQELSYVDEGIPVTFFNSDGDMNEDVDSISLADIAEQHYITPEDFDLSVLAIQSAHNDPDLTKRTAYGDYQLSGNYIQDDKSSINDDEDYEVPVRFLRPYNRITPPSE